MADKNFIPLFPLGVVLFPQMPLPLHIFEERYKELTRYCLEKKQVFGVVLQNEERHFNIGCTARIVEVLHEFDDGRLNILTEGVKRFSIDSVSEEAPYLQASVRFFNDAPTRSKTVHGKLKESGLDFLLKLFKEMGQPVDDAEFEQLTAKQISFLIASFGGYTQQEKQSFLEITNTGERLRKELALRDTILNRMEKSRKISKTIQSNGHIPGIKPSV